MVMEASGVPTPQSVGREFVRQYYTLLNKAPDHLHRFYNNASSFIHGGLDSGSREPLQVIVGQKNIHDRILELRFNDCHAKISHVDSQATLGEGVVVQVSGELSNNGQPMRRFTQTFVLACQSPKKYYVHNDVFRYQDMYDDEDSLRNDLEEDSEHVNVNNVASTDSNLHRERVQQLYYTNPITTAANLIPTYAPSPLAAVPQVNGHEDSLKNISTQTNNVLNAPPMQVAQVIVPMAPVDHVVIPEVIPVAEIKEVFVVPEPIVNPVVIETKEVERQEIRSEKIRTPPAMAPSAPKTYANLVKQGPFSVMSADIPYTHVAPQQKATFTPEVNNDMGSRQRSERPPMRDFKERERRISNTTSHFYDNQQLFFGNVPQHATEDDLREVFSEYGKVAELRIHSKAGQKNGLPSNRPVPNYGFITFEDDSSVQKCLAAVPIYYPAHDPNGSKLNIEEKKNRKMNGANGSSGQRENRDGPRDERPRNGGMHNRNGSGQRQTGDRQDRGDRNNGGRSFGRLERPGGQGTRTNGNAGGGGGGQRTRQQ